MIDFFKTLKIILPQGSAYNLPVDSQHRELMEALSKEPERICDFFNDVLVSGIPGIIPSEALPDWEEFLALEKNDSLTNEERNERISGKLSAQGGQGPDYIQDTLQMAGYPLYVTENIPSISPSAKQYVATLGGITLGETTLGSFTNRIDPRSEKGLLIAGPPVYTSERVYNFTLGVHTLGETTLGDYTGTFTKEIEPVIPAIPSRFIFVWFLTGPGGVGDFVDISSDKKNDLIKQILLIKPAHTWVLVQVNFI